MNTHGLTIHSIDNFESLSIDDRIQFIHDEINAAVEALDVGSTPQDVNYARKCVLTRNGAMGEWLKELRKDSSELTESQLQILQAPPFNFCGGYKEKGEKQTAEAVSKRRAVLEEFQLKYGAFTRPPKKDQTRLSKGLPKEYTDLGNLIQGDINSFRDYGKAGGPSKAKKGPGKRPGKKYRYQKVSDEMVAMYRDLDIVEFEDATNTTASSLITMEQLQAVHDADDASDQAQGINEPEELTIAPPPKRTRRTRSTAEV